MWPFKKPKLAPNIVNVRKGVVKLTAESGATFIVPITGEAHYYHSFAHTGITDVVKMYEMKRHWFNSVTSYPISEFETLHNQKTVSSQLLEIQDHYMLPWSVYV